METNNHIYVVTLPLKTQPFQEHLLNKMLIASGKIHNAMNAKMYKIYDYVTQTNDYINATNKLKFLSNYSHQIKNTKNNIVDFRPFTKFGFVGFVGKFNKRYSNCGINSTLLQSIATNLFAGWDKLLKNKAKQVHYKKHGEYESLRWVVSNGRFCCLNLNLENNTITIKYNKNKILTIPFLVNTNSLYELTALSQEIRTITIKKSVVRGKDKFFLSIGVKGKIYTKGRQLGVGSVGIDLGTSTVAMVSDNNVRHDILAYGIDNIETKLKLKQRKLDRSIRATNPSLFNDNGEIIKIKKGQKRNWIFSNNAIKLKKEIKELHRKSSVARKNKHIQLANIYLPSGNDFKVDSFNVSAAAKKSTESKIKKNGKIASKKRYGKTIANRAPSMFIEILKNKVETLGGKFTKINNKNATTQFDFTDSETPFKPHSLNQRIITLSNGDIHSRDLLSAFNVKNIIVAENDKKSVENYNVDKMRKDYTNFYKLEKCEIIKHKKRLKPTMKTVGVFNC